MASEMRTGPAARDADFRGIDPDALNQLVKQVQDAQNAIKTWLNGHRPPPGVSAAGYRQADQVALWAADQLGMLTRRYNYAITHPDKGGGVTPPPVPPPPKNHGSGGNGSAPPPKVRPPKTPRHHTTPKGAGGIGNFPNRQAAAKAAKADALAVAKAIQDHKPVPDSVWTHLKANADDPDYTEKLIERLGPAGVADLIKAAHGDKAKLHAIQEALGTASHHVPMDVKWLRAMLAEADRTGVRPALLQILNGAELSRRTHDALGKLGIPGLHPKDASPTPMAG